MVVLSLEVGFLDTRSMKIVLVTGAMLKRDSKLRLEVARRLSCSTLFIGDRQR